MDTGLGSFKMLEFDDIDELQIEIQPCGHHGTLTNCNQTYPI
jgi:hypothetical protein